MGKINNLSDLLASLEPLLCLFAIAFIVWRREAGKYKCLTAFLTIRLLSSVVEAQILHLSGTHINVRLAYSLYFFTYWPSFAIEAALSFGIVYELFKRAMAPLPGIQRLGMLMFRWAAAIAGIVAVGLAIGPHLSSQDVIMRAVLQLQQTESILTLCLLLFVTFAARPMGLTYRSRIFGVSLALGMLATSDLVASSWLSRAIQMNSTVNLLTGIGYALALVTWALYFAVPEPKRQLIVLPTTSPFLRWNQISLALGDAPGFVAVGGIDPGFLAPAEVIVMERASVKMNALAAKN